jgi:hypothetical protein
MFIRLFRSHQNVQLLTLLIISLLLWSDGFFRMQAAVGENPVAPLYSLLFGWAFSIPWLSTIVAFLMLLAEAFLLNQFLTDEGLAQRNSYMAAFLFFTFYSYSPGLLLLYPTIPANFLLLFALRMILKSRHVDKAYQEILSAGILIGLASMFEIRFLVYFPLLWISLVLFRSYTWREWAISIIGLLLPLAYLVTFHYLTDTIHEQIALFVSFFRSLRVIHAVPQLHPTTWALWGVLSLFTLIAFLNLLSHFTEKIIVLRKAFLIIIWTFLFSLLELPISDGTQLHLSAMILLPASVFVCAWAQGSKKARMVEVFLWLLAIAIIAAKVMS